MPAQINTILTQSPPVICDFGWYYGTVGSPSRLPEFIYSVNTVNYPPGYTTLASGVTLPTGANVVVASTASLEASGVIEFYAGLLPNQRTTSPYTVVDSTHINCTGGSGTFVSGIPMFDPRFYVDSIPTNQNIVFDAIDFNNIGIPTTQTPTGISIVSYLWNLGNGLTGSGPYTSTTYTYGTPGMMITLQVTDNLNRSWSCAHRVDIQTQLRAVEGAVLIERPSNLSYR